MSESFASSQSDIGDDVGEFTHDPFEYAIYAYPWGEDRLSAPGPRVWQGEVLKAIKDHLDDTPHMPLRIAVASGHGIGKSALIGMICNWAADTAIDTKVVVTANTETQLRTKLWPEISKWFRLSITAEWWDIGALSAKSLLPNNAARLDAISWSANNTEAFQGLHNEGKRIVVIFDEGSNIADKVWEVTEGALTDEYTEIIWVVFANPTRATGRFRDCFRSKLWKTWAIDSRNVEGTNKALFEQWKQEYGEDSDFFKVRVRGMFPSQSAKQFIPEHDVDAAYGRHLRINQYGFAPVIIGVDPAWTGDDDLCIVLRQGLMSKVLHTMARNDDDVLVANLVARYEDEYHADAIFVDGGYGTGIVSAGKAMGRNWQIVWFGGKSNDPGCKNKRAEMWNSVRLWLKEGAALPLDAKLRDELLAPEIVGTLDGKIQLESKESMKHRGQMSPNRADALALTFAQPVAPRVALAFINNKVKTDYDPFG